MLEYGARIHDRLLYLGKVNNREQENACYYDLIKISNEMGNAFGLFDNQLKLAIEEKEILDKVENIDLERLLKELGIE